MAVDQYAITTLAALKAHLGITASTDDAILEAAIDRATYAIEAYLDRKVVQRRIKEWTSSSGGSAIIVKNPPVSHVHFIGSGTQLALTVSRTVQTDLSNTVSVSDLRVTITRVDSSGNETTSQINFANHNTAGEIVSHINTSVTGFSATLGTNCVAERLNRIVGRDLRYAPVLLTFPDQAQYDVTGDLERGMLYMSRSDDGFGNFPVGPVSVFVDYDGGFETVPPDIVLACLQMASAFYAQRGRDTSVASESFGDYSYSVRSGAEMDSETRRLLAPWKRYR